jgi:hypothetical protein
LKYVSPRFVLGYQAGTEWAESAREAISILSKVWGSNGAAIVPIDDSGLMKSDLYPFLRMYDPDYIATAILGQEWHVLSDEFATQIDSCCSPFKGFDQDERHYRSHEIRWLSSEYSSGRELATISDDPSGRTFVLNLSNLESAVALMIETRIGSLLPDSRNGRHVIELPVKNEDVPGLIRLAITGQTLPAMWDIQARYQQALGAGSASHQTFTIDQFLVDTPFARSARQTLGVRYPFPELATVCVIGETADDHSLAMLCDRLFHHAVWVPTHLIDVENPLYKPILLAFSVFPSVTGVGRADDIYVTTVSESAASLQPFIDKLNSMYGGLTVNGKAVPPGRSFKMITPDELVTRSGNKMVADSAAWSVLRRVPVSREAQLGRFSVEVGLECLYRESEDSLHAFGEFRHAAESLGDGEDVVHPAGAEHGDHDEQEVGHVLRLLAEALNSR